MPDAKHTPPGDTSFAASVAQHVGAAAALIVILAGAFWAVGAIRSDASGTEVSVGANPDAESPSSGQPGTPPDETAAASSGTTGASPDAEAPTAGATGTPSATPSPAAADIPPGEVSIQVLDGVHDAGAVTAHRLADRLDGDGYDVVVVNSAATVYEKTTVLYTPGNEAAARQLASAYGFPEVREKPANLSDSVDVHVVVGTDQA